MITHDHNYNDNNKDIITIMNNIIIITIVITNAITVTFVANTIRVPGMIKAILRHYNRSDDVPNPVRRHFVNIKTHYVSQVAQAWPGYF